MIRAATNYACDEQRREDFAFSARTRSQDPNSAKVDLINHPNYRAYFTCWNQQRYYEAHDVLEQLWLNKNSPDDDFFKGLIQAAGAFRSFAKKF